MHWHGRVFVGGGVYTGRWVEGFDMYASSVEAPEAPHDALCNGD